MKRLHLKISPNRQPVNFNHLPVLVGVLHKWLGPNTEHDELSLYSFSWLQGAKPISNGLQFPHGATWFISTIYDDFLSRSIQGIFCDPDIHWGMRVETAQLVMPPVFPAGVSEQRFLCASPIFIKRSLPDASRPSGWNDKHYHYTDPESGRLLTETLQHKLSAAGLDDSGVTVRFDRDYPKARKVKVTYRGIGNMANICPVFVTGTVEQLAFTWSVGLGNCTGAGFGALEYPS